MTPDNTLSGKDLDPNAFEFLISDDVKAFEGLGVLIAEIKENPDMRRALLLRTATVLRERLQNLHFEASCSEPITIEAQDALLLLDLLLRRLG